PRRPGLGSARQIRPMEIEGRTKWRYIARCPGRHHHERDRRHHLLCPTACSPCFPVLGCHYYPHPAVDHRLCQCQFLPGYLQPYPSPSTRWIPDCLYAVAKSPGGQFCQVRPLRAIYYPVTHLFTAIPGANLRAWRLFPVSHFVLHSTGINETHVTC